MEDEVGYLKNRIQELEELINIKNERISKQGDELDDLYQQNKGLEEKLRRSSSIAEALSIEALQKENQRLRKEIKEQKRAYRLLKKELDELVEKSSPIWEAEGKYILELEEQNKSLTQQLENVHKYADKNERKKPGRKVKFSLDEVENIKNAYAEGKSYRALAKEFECSIGLISKILKE